MCGLLHRYIVPSQNQKFHTKGWLSIFIDVGKPVLYTDDAYRLSCLLSDVEVKDAKR